MAHCSRGPKKYLKCFCNCSELTLEEVEKIYRLNTQETLINPQACNLFHKFLEQETYGDDSEAKQYLQIYEKCEEYINGIKDKILTEDEVEILSDLGLEYNQEKELQKVVLTGDAYKIEMCLRRIQGGCRNNIECSDEYERFKDALLKKIRNANA